jgi:hypothetical protein
MKFALFALSKLSLLLVFLLCVDHAFAQNNDLLNRVRELQETASKASGGVLGCGVGGTIQIKTSRGNISAYIGDDAIYVFGREIAVRDLLVLIKSRIESNSTGKVNQMSGEVGSLIYVIMDVLSLSKDPESVPVIGELLADQNDRIVQYSYFALLKLGKSDPGLQKQVENIVFPESAVKILKSYGIKLPVWAKTR